MKRAVSIVLLIVALLLVAAGIAISLWFSFARGGIGLPFDAYRISAESEESKNYSSEGVTTLKVQDDAGDVSILSGEGNQITVKAHKTAWGTSREDAEQALANLKFTVTKSGDTLTVKYEIRQTSFTAQNRPDIVDFLITVPEEMNVTVDANFGTLELTGLTGNASLDSDFGDITIDNLEGTLSATTQSGTITARTVNAGTNDIFLRSGFGRLILKKVVAGKLQVESESGLIDLEDVRALDDMELSTNFGDIQFENGSAGKLLAATESGKVELTSLRVSGALEVNDQFGSITLQQVSAESYDLDTESGAIEVQDVNGALKAHSGFGSITINEGNDVSTLNLSTESGTVSFAGTLGDGPHTVHSDFGEIIIVIPSDIGLDVDLKTEFGKIKSALPIAVTITENLDANHLVGTINGGGSEFTATTQSGNIQVEVLAK